MGFFQSSFLCLGLLAAAVEATHFRYATFSYSVPDPVGAPYTVEITSLTAWRATSSINQFDLVFGDGSPNEYIDDAFSTVVGSYNDANGEPVVFLEKTVTHTYPGPGPYTFGMSDSCCRISSLSNAPDGNYGAKARLLLGSGGDSSSPEVNVPSLITFQAGLSNVLDLDPFISDIDQDPFTCTPGAVGTAGSATPSTPTLVGVQVMVTPDCKLQWDLSSYVLPSGSTKHAFLFSIENSKGVIIPVDVVIEVIPEAAISLTCPAIGPTVFSAEIGETVTVDFELTGPGTVGGVAPSIIGPPGATIVTSSPSSAPIDDTVFTFSYTVPPGTPDDDYIFTLQFLVGGQQCLASVQLNVCTDTDGDTVCDGFDICPDGDDLIDTDGDGFPDACDECPNDPQNRPGCDDGVNNPIGGDPHFLRWGHDRRSSFHGECDLVLVHAENFGQDEGLSVQLRTTIAEDSTYSYVEAAAVKIAEVIVEFQNDHFLVDGESKSYDNLPHVLPNGRKIFRKVKEGSKTLRQYRLELNDSTYFDVKINKVYMTVAFKGSPLGFEGSQGMLGSFPTGELVARDGRILDSYDEFGFEWQVQPGNDHELFKESRRPMLPYERCRMPLSTDRRNLRGEDKELKKAAVDACNGAVDFDLCVNDVMLTGEVGMAEMFVGAF